MTGGRVRSEISDVRREPSYQRWWWSVWTDAKIDDIASPYISVAGYAITKLEAKNNVKRYRKAVRAAWDVLTAEEAPK